MTGLLRILKRLVEVFPAKARAIALVRQSIGIALWKTKVNVMVLERRGRVTKLPSVEAR